MSRTAAALAALPTRTAPAPTPPGLAQRTTDAVTGWLARRTSRRGFLVRAGVVGSALAVDPTGYVLRPGSAYAAVCGPGASCSSGWTVFCATVNKGVNACPPGSIAAGWWKMDGASLCGGKSRYIIDCNATCSRCSTPGTRAGICAKPCQSCSCTCGPSSSCDQRRVCCNDFRYGQCNTQVRQVGAVQCRVASCTPPWQFENCTTSPATDNRTVDHNSSELPTRYTRITARYISIGENGSRLGASVYRELSVTGGSAQRYQAGRISWSSATGAWETVGGIGARYRALGHEGGRLRFPLDKERPTAEGRGYSQAFQGGRIWWSSPTGAWETVGGIGARYTQLGEAAGSLGFPLSGETATEGGYYQRFERGRVSWSRATDAHETRGKIGRRYVELGAEQSRLGFPTRGERDTAGATGRYSAFQNGRISWSSATGAWETVGGIGARYAALGHEGGRLRFPVREERRTATGRGYSQPFQGGDIWWSSPTGAWETVGGIGARYSELGGGEGTLGFPLSAEAASAGGWYQRFQRGRISHSSTYGSRWMGEAIAEEYVRLGAEGGELGFPVQDEAAVTGTALRRVVFERGRLTYDPATGEVTRD